MIPKRQLRINIFLPRNHWVVSVRILKGVAGRGRFRSFRRSVASTPSLIQVENVILLLHACKLPRD